MSRPQYTKPLVCGCVNRKHFALGFCQLHYKQQYLKKHPVTAAQRYLYGRRKLRKYGIEPEDYDRMLIKQGGKCAICSSPTARNRGRHFYVDHNHKTGRVRGLLCAPCNLAVGHMKDDPETLRKAALYLEAYL